jgi:WD40 repeat protein
MLAGSKAGIHRYKLNGFERTPMIYSGHDGKEITSLRWNKNIIASGGNGVVQIWDANQQGDNIKPIHTLRHDGVRCIEFYPGTNKNLLVSGGNGGLKFWNVQNGELRKSIDIDLLVTGVVWSKPEEILVSHGNRLSLWRLDTKPIKISDHATRGDKILTMDQQAVSGRVVCVHGDEIITVYAIHGGLEPSKQSGRGAKRKFGLLEPPAIR